MNPRSGSPEAAGGAFAELSVVWALAAVVLLDLFLAEWGYGIARGVLLSLLAACFWAFPRAREKYSPMFVEPRGAAWAAGGVAAVFFALNVQVGLSGISEAFKRGVVREDQGQNAYRAIVYLQRGVDPYGVGTFLDP